LNEELSIFYEEFRREKNLASGQSAALNVSYKLFQTF